MPLVLTSYWKLLCNRKLTCSFLLLLLSSFSQADGGEFTVGTGASPPYHNDDLSGIIDRVLIEAFFRAGYQLKIETLPAERSIVSANHGTLDGDLFRVEGLSAHFPNLIQSGEPIFKSFYSAFSVKTIEGFTGLNSLSNYRIGIVRGHKILENHTEGMNRQLVNNATELFERLEIGSFDIVLMNKMGAESVLKELNITSVNALEPPILTRNIHFYMHRSHEDVLAQIDQALRQMKQDGSYLEIVNTR
jgi:polar amino acid transport system substrate-binding protein